jgi:hypothetical protein
VSFAFLTARVLELDARTVAKTGRIHHRGVAILRDGGRLFLRLLGCDRPGSASVGAFVLDALLPR